MVDPIRNSGEGDKNLSVDKQTGNAFGRFFIKLGNTLKHITKKAIECLSEIKKNPSALSKSLKIVGFGIMGAAYGSANPGRFSSATRYCSNGVNMIESLQTPDDINYFASGEYKKDKPVEVAGRAIFSVADVGGFVSLLDETKVINLGKIASNIGRVKAFSFVTKIGFSTVLRSVAAIGYVLVGAGAIQRLVEGGNKAQKTKAWLDLAHSIAEIALNIFLIIGITSAIGSLVGTIVLGVIAASIGLASFVYGHCQKKQLTMAT